MDNNNLSTLPVAVVVILAIVIVIQIILVITALRDLYKRPVNQIVFTNKWIWVAIIFFANLLGPILYLAAGRKPTALSGSVTPPPIDATKVADILYGPDDSKPQK